MNRTRLVWGILLLIVGLGLLVRATTTGMGRRYVRAVPIAATETTKGWTKYEAAMPKERNDANVSLSVPRTVGLWLAAFLTLAAFSFLGGDNVFFKLSQAIIVGVSAGYTVATAFWMILIPDLLSKLIPNTIRAWAVPGLPPDQKFDWTFLIPSLLCVLLLCRLLPRGGWISRWPLAFFIGITAGLKLIAYFKADFIDQINNTMLPLIATVDGKFHPWNTLRNIVLLLGTLASLVYFFFSVEHRGVVRHVSRMGICVLMITFGASFGYTVMGRITLLAARLQFLFDDWLWLIDPLNRRG